MRVKFTVEVEVADCWIEDGFEFTPDRIEAFVLDGLSHDLRLAYLEEELDVELVSKIETVKGKMFS